MTKVILYDNMVLRKGDVINIYELDFYMKENGKVPVQDFLYSLNPKLRAKAFK